MKLNRQFGILMHLLSHDKTTARELAERFEVSSRTIRHDMEDLSMAGIPVYTSQGTGGGIRLIDGYSLSPPGIRKVRRRRSPPALHQTDTQHAVWQLAENSGDFKPENIRCSIGFHSNNNGILARLQT